MARALPILFALFLAPLCFCYNSSEYTDTVGLGWESILDTALYDNQTDVIETYVSVKSRTQNVDTWYWVVFTQIQGDLKHWVLSIELWDDWKHQLIWSVDQAVGENSSISLQQNGDLVLKNESQLPVWSISAPNATNLRLSKDGYLELIDERNNSFWSSFSSPTSYLVCGQVLKNGSRLVNGNYSFQFNSTGASLTYNMQYAYKSWSLGTNSSDSSVFAALCCDASGAYLQIRSDPGNISENDYLLINWVNCGGASVLADILSLSISAVEYVAFASIENGILSIIKLWNDTKISIPQGSEACTVPNSCGSYGLCKNGTCSGCVMGNSTYLEPLSSQNNGASGCKVKYESGNCEMVIADEIDFYEMDALPSLTNINEQSCSKSCEDSSTCKAAFYQRHHNYCFLVDKVNSLSYANQSYAAFFKLCKSNSGKNSSFSLILGVTLSSIAACAFVLVILCIYLRRKKITRDESEVEDEILASCLSESTLKKFSFEELDVITTSFSEKLGEGGFGSVYKGLLPDGRYIAVKVLRESSQETPDFYAEISVLSRVRHLHLVLLLGFAARKSKRALVYEYMANGSLDQWLMGKRPGMLCWEDRMEIAVGAAKGLAYMHEECHEKILHLDVKPQNILLDENFRPKVADFGLSRLVDRRESGVFMTTVRGTPGYLSPELCEGEEIDVKTDVYSFGVVLLEIISGAKLSHLRTQEISDYNGLVDKKLKDCFDANEARRMLEVANLCINQDPELRPFMSIVVQMLEGKETIPHTLSSTCLKKINTLVETSGSIITFTSSAPHSYENSKESSITTY